MLYLANNIFNSECESVVNTINVVGVMGSGLALEFKKRYPKMYADYYLVCEQGKLKAGDVWPWENPKSNPRIIFNFATKGHWRLPSEYSYIEKGLQQLKEQIEYFKVKSICIPKLGCKNGRLSWDKVKPMIVEMHDKYWKDIKVELCE